MRGRGPRMQGLVRACRGVCAYKCMARACKGVVRVCQGWPARVGTSASVRGSSMCFELLRACHMCVGALHKLMYSLRSRTYTILHIRVKKNEWL